METHGRASQEAAFALAASFLPGSGRKALWKAKPALETAKTEADVLAAVSAVLRKPVTAAEWDFARREADFALAECRKIWATVACVLDPKFPRVLAGIPDAPFLLTYQGPESLVCAGGALDSWNGLAVVGTREATPEGKANAEWLVRKVAEAKPGAVIVSGLAEGVDIAAHRAAMANGLRTVAVMGKDLRRTYPAAHRADAEDIVAAGGALVSEYFPRLKESFAPAQFVERDRLQPGLSRAAVAVQCGAESGTMHAMRAAAEQGRSLWAVRYKNPAVSPGSEALVAGTAKAGKAPSPKPVGAKARGISSSADAAELAGEIGTPPGSAGPVQQTIL